MPYQNRVDPLGQIIATPARGTLMGNRGCLHDAGDRPLRQYQSRRWIICVLDFKGRTRPSPMPPGHYSSLFFLDEATALAAGHRPCAECQRERFASFRAHWLAANVDMVGGAAALVEAIDLALHRERIGEGHRQRDRRKLTYSAALDDLPDGAMVLHNAPDTPYLVHGDALYPWSFAGYGAPVARTGGLAQVLTPRSTVRAIAHGYQPAFHPSSGAG